VPSGATHTRYRLHDLRAQFAVALLTQGADIETVREAMRHRTIVTTSWYLRLAEGRVAEAVRGLRLPAVNESPSPGPLGALRGPSRQEVDTQMAQAPRGLPSKPKGRAF
jgi:hypothetical protein